MQRSVSSEALKQHFEASFSDNELILQEMHQLTFFAGHSDCDEINPQQRTRRSKLASH